MVTFEPPQHLISALDEDWSWRIYPLPQIPQSTRRDYGQKTGSTKEPHSNSSPIDIYVLFGYTHSTYYIQST